MIKLLNLSRSIIPSRFASISIYNTYIIDLLTYILSINADWLTYNSDKHLNICGLAYLKTATNYTIFLNFTNCAQMWRCHYCTMFIGYFYFSNPLKSILTHHVPVSEISHSSYGLGGSRLPTLTYIEYFVAYIYLLIPV